MILLNRTEEMIVETAIELFKTNGYNETSLHEICKACGITKGTFYYHFNAKSDIIFRYYEFLFSNIIYIMPELITMKDTKKKLWKLYEYSIDNTVSLTPPLLNAMLIADAQNGLLYFSPLKAGSASPAHNTHSQLIHELIVQAQEEGTIQKEKNPKNLMETFNAAIIGIALDWSSTHADYNQKDKLYQMFEIIFS